MIKFQDALELQQLKSQEFYEIYNLVVVIVPTNKEMIRKDWNDQIFRTELEKNKAIIEKVVRKSKKGSTNFNFYLKH